MKSSFLQVAILLLLVSNLNSEHADEELVMDLDEQRIKEVKNKEKFIPKVDSSVVEDEFMDSVGIKGKDSESETNPKDSNVENHEHVGEHGWKDDVKESVRKAAEFVMYTAADTMEHMPNIGDMAEELQESARGGFVDMERRAKELKDEIESALFKDHENKEPERMNTDHEPKITKMEYEPESDNKYTMDKSSSVNGEFVAHSVPDSSEDLQETIKHRLQDGLHKVQELAEEVRESFSHMTDESDEIDEDTVIGMNDALKKHLPHKAPLSADATHLNPEKDDSQNSHIHEHKASERHEDLTVSEEMEQQENGQCDRNANFGNDCNATSNLESVSYALHSLCQKLANWFIHGFYFAYGGLEQNPEPVRRPVHEEN